MNSLLYPLIAVILMAVVCALADGLAVWFWQNHS
jgi:preprotein translocase subunit SecE